MTSPYRVLPLTQGYVAVIDAEDWRKVSRYKWHVNFSRGRGRAHGLPYARASINGKRVYLHRYLLVAKPENHVDHKNWQTLDCRKENLLEMTPTQNLARMRKKKQMRKECRVKTELTTG